MIKIMTALSKAYQKSLAVFLYQSGKILVKKKASSNS